MRSACRYLRFCLLVLTLGFWDFSAKASESLLREETYAAAMQNTIEPWFAAGESGFFEGIPAASKSVRLFYRAFRRSDARADLVIVHGFGERSEKYAELAYDFFQAGLNVFVYDQRGFGQSSRLLPKSSAVYVDHFASYAVDLKIFVDKIVHAEPSSRPLLIFAHSMGGAVSSLFVKIYPTIAKALILSSPMHQPLLGGLPPGLVAGIATLADFIGFGKSYVFGHKGPRQQIFEKAATRSWARWNHFVGFTSRPEQAAKATGGASFHWLREALLTTASFQDPEFVSSIKSAVLIFQAADDTLVDNEYQDRFCELAPSCTLVRIPMSKHEIYREKDNLRVPYMQKIREFVDQETGPFQIQ